MYIYIHTNYVYIHIYIYIYIYIYVYNIHTMHHQPRPVFIMRVYLRVQSSGVTLTASASPHAKNPQD